jgi:hypothetical protein
MQQQHGRSIASLHSSSLSNQQHQRLAAYPQGSQGPASSSDEIRSRHQRLGQELDLVSRRQTHQQSEDGSFAGPTDNTTSMGLSTKINQMMALFLQQKAEEEVRSTGRSRLLSPRERDFLNKLK